MSDLDAPRTTDSAPRSDRASRSAEPVSPQPPLPAAAQVPAPRSATGRTRAGAPAAPAGHSADALPAPADALPRHLTAPTPGWVTDADVVVVGSGIAGLTAALELAQRCRVVLVTKTELDAGSTRWAQGGIAAALGVDDAPDLHGRDTMIAGAGLCDPAAVGVLVAEGPGGVRDLLRYGTRFDHEPDGRLALTREGGHGRDRIAHAGGDATGAEIERALVASTLADPRIEVIEHALALDALVDAAGRVTGVTLHVIGRGTRDGVGAVTARAVLLCSGGLGQVFDATTNPSVATGDGVALALRAGASVADLEFVQFHPTVLWLGPDASGQQPLVSEALRGEGALLLDASGHRFMVDVHPLAELAPRDVVAKAALRAMRADGAEHVWLDARHLGAEFLERRFPTILASCRAHGVDPARDLVPVAPAAHYASGGVRTDLDGRTGVAGLWAAGEVACTGVHGANRLASNSLLEGVVFARRAVRSVTAALASTDAGDPSLVAAGPAHAAEPSPAGTGGTRTRLVDPAGRRSVQRAMSSGAGVLRSAASLAATAAVLREVEAGADAPPDTAAWEATNLHTVATVLVHAATLRAETRGSHWREDHPDADDARWRVRIVHTLVDGRVVTGEEPVPAGVDASPAERPPVAVPGRAL